MSLSFCVFSHVCGVPTFFFYSLGRSLIGFDNSMGVFFCVCELIRKTGANGMDSHTLGSGVHQL
jgi:hypothetical protein